MIGLSNQSESHPWLLPAAVYWFSSLSAPMVVCKTLTEDALFELTYDKLRNFKNPYIGHVYM